MKATEYWMCQGPMEYVCAEVTKQLAEGWVLHGPLVSIGENDDGEDCYAREMVR